MKVKSLFLMLYTLCMVSCMGLTHVTVPQSNINIVDKDIETQRYVSYTLKKTYVLGIGGMSKRARNTNVIDELMKIANLQKNEALAYITVSRNINSYAGVVGIAKITASGYVVRPTGGKYQEHIAPAVEEKAQLQVQMEISDIASVQQEDFIKLVTGKSDFEVRQLAQRELMKIKSQIDRGEILEAKQRFGIVAAWYKEYYSSHKENSTLKSFLNEIQQNLYNTVDTGNTEQEISKEAVVEEEKVVFVDPYPTLMDIESEPEARQEALKILKKVDKMIKDEPTIAKQYLDSMVKWYNDYYVGRERNAVLNAKILSLGQALRSK